VALVVAGRRCLVVGGGPVAARKAAALAGCGARVTVVAPHVVEAIDALASTHGVEVDRRCYRAGEAAGYRLVVTATGIPEVDRAVVEDAEAAGLWVNSANDAARSSMMLPAVHRDGPVTVAVSTGGASPALASWLRRRLQDALGPGLATLADVLETARSTLKARGISTAGVDWQALLDGPLPGLVAEGRLDEARRLIEGATPPRPERHQRPGL
jgi:precorrin-2 dehydrogenase / sirohydrochlorin ferrochelatase